MSKTHPVRSALLLLVLGGAVGYGIGLGIGFLMSGNLNFTGSVASAFTLLFGVTAFFLGLYGYRGITRGLVWQVIGILLGGFFVTGIRALVGSEQIFGPFFFSEPAWVVGALVGDISFLFGVGVMDGWMKWVRGEPMPEHHEDEPGWSKYFDVSLDHKVIGIQYTMTALVLISIGGTVAMVFRTELAHSGLQFLTTNLNLFDQNGPKLYNTL